MVYRNLMNTWSSKQLRNIICRSMQGHFFSNSIAPISTVLNIQNINYQNLTISQGSRALTGFLKSKFSSLGYSCASFHCHGYQIQNTNVYQKYKTAQMPEQKTSNSNQKYSFSTVGVSLQQAIDEANEEINWYLGKQSQESNVAGSDFAESSLQNAINNKNTLNAQKYYSQAQQQQPRQQYSAENSQIASLFGTDALAAQPADAPQVPTYQDTNQSPNIALQNDDISRHFNNHQSNICGHTATQQDVSSQRVESSSGNHAGLSHVDSTGKASMVDVGQKTSTSRVARASAVVLLDNAAYKAVKENAIKKGDVLSVAELAGTMGAKHTALLIPLCHQINITKSRVTASLCDSRQAVVLVSEVTCVGQTGVEMEALTGVSVGALTVYDMCKAISKGAVISDVRLEYKSGGKSGVWERGGVQGVMG